MVEDCTLLDFMALHPCHLIYSIFNFHPCQYKDLKMYVLLLFTSLRAILGPLLGAI